MNLIDLPDDKQSEYLRSLVELRMEMDSEYISHLPLNKCPKWIAEHIKKLGGTYAFMGKEPLISRWWVNNLLADYIISLTIEHN